VPRNKEKLKLTRITKLDDIYTEFVFDNGIAFQRRNEHLDPNVNLHVNLVVYVESITNGESAMVTGMWVPEQGWAFRMTAEDLADYAKDLSALLHTQRNRARAELRSYISLALLEGLKEQVGVTPVVGLYDGDGDPGETGEVTLGGPIRLDILAQFVMDAMDQAKSAGAR
jgi:hypothetical protein